MRAQHRKVITEGCSYVWRFPTQGAVNMKSPRVSQARRCHPADGSRLRPPRARCVSLLRRRQVAQLFMHRTCLTSLASEASQLDLIELGTADPTCRRLPSQKDDLVAPRAGAIVLYLHMSTGSSPFTVRWT